MDATIEWHERSDSDVFLEVVLRGGKPWGFTLVGGEEYDRPISIAEVSLRMIYFPVMWNAHILQGFKSQLLNHIHSVWMRHMWKQIGRGCIF